MLRVFTAYVMKLNIGLHRMINGAGRDARLVAAQH